jgi:dehydrogenase/reductase SDR family member 1
MTDTLKGRVAIVTGASRGVGKGIALGLAEAGATVYVTGRTVQSGTAYWPGSIVETAAEIDRLGGEGIAVRCDHADDEDVERLFERVRGDRGRLDILVNNAFATPDGDMPTNIAFWELPIAFWDRLHEVGVRSHYVAAWHAARQMAEQGRGLIVNVSSGGAARYVFGVAYGAGKAAVDKMAKDMAHELRPFGVAAVSLWPGPVKTEKTLTHPERLPPAVAERILKFGESPIFSGRAVAALAGDPDVMEKSGQVLVVADLSKEYGFTDPARDEAAV